MAVKQEEDQITRNASFYTLVLNIINTLRSWNYESVIAPLEIQIYRTDYQLYLQKRVEISEEMIIRKSKDLDSSSHKKKKSSRKDYEKWKKKKIEKLSSYGHYAKDCRVKEKIKNFDIDDNLKDSLYKIMLNSDSGSGSEYSSREYSSTSEDLKALQQEEYGTSEEECSPCQQGMACEKDNEDDLYKIYEQFKEMSLNVIDNDKVIELLQDIKDPEIRAQIIDKISDSKGKDHITEKDYIPKEIPTKEGSYTMAEVKNLLLERRKMVSSPTTISDLKEEINNLKENITLLKEKNVVIEVRLDAIQTLQNLDNASKSSSSMEGENDNLDFIKNLSLKNDKTDFLYSLKAFTSQNFIKQEINSIELDHILQNPKLQEKITILRNQFSIDICGDHPNTFWNRKKHLMYFFIEFSIPWIMRWSIEVNTTRKASHAYKEYYDTNTITESQVKDNNTDPFKKIARQLQMKKGIISKSKAIALYMEEVKRDLMKNLDFDIKDDASMASAIIQMIHVLQRRTRLGGLRRP
ncbi:hypothetical protein H5410_043176 [Solanum commersonii]|uniref:Uncharacterized protein n=1 Tax=Solanum commersonii TaxID=4109 RepID=A0A9J5Y0N8_SOLCO|nr:hypothetical protein H5410_043176 [Solanum commersonii]